MFALGMLFSNIETVTLISAFTSPFPTVWASYLLGLILIPHMYQIPQSTSGWARTGPKKALEAKQRKLLAFSEVKGNPRTPATPPDPGGIAQASLSNPAALLTALSVRPGLRHSKARPTPQPSRLQPRPTPSAAAPLTQAPKARPRPEVPSHASRLTSSLPGTTGGSLTFSHPHTRPRAAVETAAEAARPSRAAELRGLGYRRRASEPHRTKPNPTSAPRS